jgi:hypothetical protein
MTTLRRAMTGTRTAVLTGGLLVLVTLLLAGRLLLWETVRPVVSARQAEAVALRSIPSVGPPFSTFSGYQAVEVRFEPRAAHLYDVYPRRTETSCPPRPAWACPAAPAWLVRLVAPPQAGYLTIQVTMLVDAVRGTVYDWDVRAAGP